MGTVKHTVIGFVSVALLAGGLTLGMSLGSEAEAGGYFNKHKRVTHKDLRADHEQLEYDHRKTHEWLEKIEAAIDELDPGAAAPLCGAGTEGQRFVPDDPTTPTEYCDNTTGLSWVKRPDSTTRNHATALTHCATLDNSGNGQTYRLPKVKELISLVDYSRASPALPAGHPFMNVQSSNYWSATTSANNSTRALNVNFSNGFVLTFGKAALCGVCVVARDVADWVI